METTLPENEEEITVAQFERWLRTSRPGSQFVYHRGNLMIDREDVQLVPGLGQYVHVYHEPVNYIGKIAWWAYEKGMVLLAQRKLPAGRFEYIAFKREQQRRR